MKIYERWEFAMKHTVTVVEQFEIVKEYYNFLMQNDMQS